MKPNSTGNQIEFLTIKQIASRWQVSERSVRRVIDRGELVVHRIGEQIRGHIDDVRSYEKQRRG